MINYEGTGVTYFEIPEYKPIKNGRTYLEIPANTTGCFFDAIWEQEKNKPPHERQMIWHLYCPCPKCSTWC